MSLEFDTSKDFVVPDDMNKEKTLWGIKFNEPVSLKRLLDALASIEAGGDIIYLNTINDDKGNIAFEEEEELRDE